MKYAALLLGPTLLVACGASDANEPAGSSGDDFDDSTLEEFRAAIPPETRLKMAAAETPANALTVGGTAALASLTIDGGTKVNFAALSVVATLRLITTFPPSLYDEAEQKFLWGPFDNDEGAGQVAVYIQKNPAGDDFEYSYAFLRLVDDDFDNAAGVIWGGSSPGGTEDGIDAAGVTLWDVEANRAFMAEHDPDFDESSPEQGRFAMVYGHGADDEGEFYFNVAAFADFLGDDATATDAPIDAQYFFGHFEGVDGNVIDFVDFEADADVCDASENSCFENDVVADTDERLAIFTAFLNRGVGRGEAVVSGGDLSAEISLVECWDEAQDQIYAGISLDSTIVDEGGACPEPLNQTLTALGVPTLADVDAELMDALICVAEMGIEGDCG